MQAIRIEPGCRVFYRDAGRNGNSGVYWVDDFTSEKDSSGVPMVRLLYGTGGIAYNYACQKNIVHGGQNHSKCRRSTINEQVQCE